MSEDVELSTRSEAPSTGVQGDGGLDSNLFQPGERVHLVQGPFGGLEAVYEMSRSQDRVLLLIDILGRKNRVTVAVDDVTPAPP